MALPIPEASVASAILPSTQERGQASAGRYPCLEELERARQLSVDWNVYMDERQRRGGSLTLNDLAR